MTRQTTHRLAVILISGVAALVGIASRAPAQTVTAPGTNPAGLEVEAVTPAGKRDIDQLAAECEKVAAGSATGLAGPSSLPGGTELFVKSGCGHSRKALLAGGEHSQARSAE